MVAQVTCSVCLEKTNEVGELDSCAHRYCWPCINTWANTENRCPSCRERFIVISRKRLRDGRSASKRTRQDLGGDGGNAQQDEDEDEGPLKRLKGTVVETRVVEDRTQVRGTQAGSYPPPPPPPPCKRWGSWRGSQWGASTDKCPGWFTCRSGSRRMSWAWICRLCPARSVAAATTTPGC